ncbi:MAG: ABC transporter ATP-binding protein [Oscillospiraceae bacterium]|nr:ABC transporter ATP-binding protein [Oscillospiraceae bacterium]
MFQLSCENLVLGYEGRVVINNLSFRVTAGDYLCIVGENGSGKTTLMKTILGLKTAMSGHIELGPDITTKDFGYLPQQISAQQDFPATVKEVVLSGCLNHSGLRPFYTKADRQLAETSMVKLSISGIASHRFAELSGGQQQRALLARALCATQKILLLDEPVSGLDMKTTADTYDIVAELNKEGTTIIMISHDINMAVQYASHILYVIGPEAVYFGSTKDFLSSNVAANLSPGGKGF